MVRKSINFGDYKKCLLDGQDIHRTMNIIRSHQHEVYSERVNKVALSREDDKRIHYEPRSKKCLNLLSTRELSNKSQNCLYKVSNQFLIWSETCLKIWDNFVIFFTVWALCGSMWTHCGKLMSQSGNFLHSVDTMWIYVNTLWQINVTEWQFSSQCGHYMDLCEHTVVNKCHRVLSKQKRVNMFTLWGLNFRKKVKLEWIWSEHLCYSLILEWHQGSLGIPEWSVWSLQNEWITQMFTPNSL